MKYYLIRLSARLPEGMGGLAQGPLITLLPKYQHDVGMIEHEKTHVRQWYAAAAIGLALVGLLFVFVSPYALALLLASVSSHGLLYRFVRPYRQWSEVQAYRKQIAVGGYSSIEFAVTHLVEHYALGLSAEEARALLTA